MDKVSTGSEVIDTFLQGGFEQDTITTLYGPSGSGKTNICLLFAVTQALQKKKVLFVDTEGGISIERIKQLTPHWEKVLDYVLLFKPTTFEDQEKAINQIKGIVHELGNDKIGTIIMDTISMLYRLELGNPEEIYDINRALGKQIAKLTEIARKKNIPVIITNQVYANFERPDQVNMVGGDLLKYGSKCLIELQKTPGEARRAIIRKHRSIKEGQHILFSIVNTGIVQVSEKKFSLF